MSVVLNRVKMAVFALTRATHIRATVCSLIRAKTAKQVHFCSMISNINILIYRAWLQYFVNLN
jgi:hypothetical protein